jgi:hypothetical protein
MTHCRRLWAWARYSGYNYFDKLQDIAGKPTKVAGKSLQGRAAILKVSQIIDLIRVSNLARRLLDWVVTGKEPQLNQVN